MVDLAELSQALVIGPDDRLAIVFEQDLSVADSKRMQQEIQEWWPGLRVAIFTNGARLSVISQSDV